MKLLDLKDGPRASTYVSESRARHLVIPFMGPTKSTNFLAELDRIHREFRVPFLDEYDTAELRSPRPFPRVHSHSALTLCTLLRGSWSVGQDSGRCVLQVLPSISSLVSESLSVRTPSRPNQRGCLLGVGGGAHDCVCVFVGLAFRGVRLIRHSTHPFCVLGEAVGR